jgi:hypothetical protein
MTSRFRRPSPALVLAIVALFVALTGSAVAAGVVPLAKRALVADTAKKALVADNAKKLGGKTAAQIVASVPAPPAPPPVTSVAALTSVVSANFTLNASTEQNVTATCAAGAKAVGGGFTNPTQALVISAGSFPTADGAGWTEDLINLSNSTAGSGTVVVTCLK